MQRNITIIENNRVYTENEEVAEKFNIYFTKAVENLEIEPFTVVEEVSMISGSISEIVKTYASHPSIIKIKENVKIKDKFKFQNITTNEMKVEINKLNSKKSCISNEIINHPDELITAYPDFEFS